MEVEPSQRQLEIATLKRHLLAQYMGAEAERVAVLFVPSGDVLCGQLLLAERRWPRDKDALLVPLIDEAALRCDAPYYVTRAQWDECERRGGARVLRLEQYRPPSPRVHCDVVEMEVECNTPLHYPAPRQIWLHALDTSQTRAPTTQYLCALLDFALLRLVPNGRAGTQTKWAGHYESVLSQDGPSEALAFALTYVRARTLCLDELLRQWMRMEVALLMRAVEHLELDQFHADLARHCTATPSAMWQHGQWHQYTAGAPLQFWSRQPDDTYHVSALWLLEDELAMLTVAPLAGLVALTCKQIRHQLVPALYRLALHDVTHTLGATGRAAVTEDECTALLLEMGTLPMQLHGVARLYEFGRDRLTNADASPVLRRTEQYLEQRRRRAEERGEQDQRWRALRLAQHVDLEDLFKQPARHLPPCLARVVPAPSYKYEDRIQLVACLLDQGYSDRERVIAALCRDKSATPDKKRVVARLLKDYVRKRATSENPEWRLSRRCGTLIDAVFQEGNLTRCPYEEKANGARRRRDHTDAEKSEFTRECACELAGGALADDAPLIYSPMDYVGQRLARNLSALSAL